MMHARVGMRVAHSAVAAATATASYMSLVRPLAATAAAARSSTRVGAALALHTTAQRHNSTLPIIQEYVRRTYPFPTILESNIPPDYSAWLYYHQQHPHDLPTYKSKLIVDIRDLGLDATARMALREMVQGRYDPKTHRVAFVSKNLPTAQANENRVFQMLDACLLEARRIGKEMNESGFVAKSSGAKANRLLAPRPPKSRVQKSRKPVAVAADGAPIAKAKRVRYTQAQKAHRALGTTSTATQKDLTPPKVPITEAVRVKAEAIKKAKAQAQAKAKTQ